MSPINKKALTGEILKYLLWIIFFIAAGAGIYFAFT